MLDALSRDAEVARSVLRPAGSRSGALALVRSILAVGASLFALPSEAATDDGGARDASTAEDRAEVRPAPDRAAAGESLVVAGVRASVTSAQELEQRAVEIIDCVVATDIHKLPDVSVSDALARVTGVQVTRDRGEGGAVSVRGLSQTVATLNGRELFTAGAGRTLDFADVPAELVSAIEVYKSSSAEQLEGGIGGLVNLRTLRPFDFTGRRIAGSARAIYGDLAGTVRPQATLLLADRWRFDGGVELGAVGSFALQERPFREDQKSAGAPKRDDSVLPGVTYSNGTSESASAGTRRRLGGSLIVESRLSDAARVYAEAGYAELRTRQDTYQMNVSAPGTFEADSPRLFAGTQDLRSITWTDAPISVLTFGRDTRDRTSQLAVGGSWHAGDLSLRADASRTDSSNRLDFSGLVLGANAPRFSQDLSGRFGATSVSGVNLLDPASFNAVSVAYRVLPYDGDLTAARADGELALGRLVDRVSAGVRVARRNAGNVDGLVYGDCAVSNTACVASVSGGVPATSVPQLVAADPYSPFMPGSTSVSGYLGGDPSVLRDQPRLRSALGITAPVPQKGGALAPWRVREDTFAWYLQAVAEVASVQAAMGVRAVATREALSGFQTVPGGAPGEVAPIEVRSSYVDWLPSLNVRWAATDAIVVRAGASRTMTRPDFSQLSPSLLLIANSIDPTRNQGSAGNPELRPFRSTNVDVAVEAYLARSTALNVTGFYKAVDGFLTSSSAPEVYDGATYQVTRPYNTNDATVRGVELGYHQFFDFLPGPLRGLGLLASYTYVESETLDPALRREVPLLNFSRNSYNLVGMYELHDITARVAYGYRDRYFSGSTSIVGVGPLPMYTRGYGWLDATVTYRFGEALSVSAEGVNLLRTVRDSRYGAATRRGSVWLNDRQLSLIIAGRA